MAQGPDEPTRQSFPAAAAAVGSQPLAAYLRRLVWGAMLPLLVLAVLLGTVRLAHLHTDEATQAEQLAHRLARQVDDVLGDRIQALTLMASSPLLQQDQLADFHRLGQAFRQQYGSEVLLADDQGRMLLHTGMRFGAPLPPLPHPQGRAAASQALSTGKPAVGDLFIDPVVKRPLVAIAVPVPAAGTPGRVLLTLIEARPFEDRFRQVAPPTGWALRCATAAASTSPAIAIRRPPWAACRPRAPGRRRLRWCPGRCMSSRARRCGRCRW